MTKRKKIAVRDGDPVPCAAPAKEVWSTRKTRQQSTNGDWRAISDDREKYQAYLCSREWAVKREAVRERCSGTCERCGVLPMNAVHHLTYARKYDEPLEDLQAICQPCHEFTHGKSDFDPKFNVNWTRYVSQIKASRIEFESESLRPVGVDVMFSPLDIVDRGETIRVIQDLAFGIRLSSKDKTEQQRERLLCAIAIQRSELLIDVVGWVLCGQPRVDFDTLQASKKAILGE